VGEAAEAQAEALSSEAEAFGSEAEARPRRSASRPRRGTEVPRGGLASRPRQRGRGHIPATVSPCWPCDNCIIPEDEVLKVQDPYYVQNMVNVTVMMVNEVLYFCIDLGPAVVVATVRTDR